tara:strand:- start:1425 stop:1718 length:294 start_codon:yes stop_codon:yes gene_type:complete
MLLLLKIILWIIAIIIISFLIVVGFVMGLMRGLKIMSIKDYPRTGFENIVVQKVFDSNPNLDPFFYSLYLKEERKLQTDKYKKEVKKLKKEISNAKK